MNWTLETGLDMILQTDPESNLRIYYGRKEGMTNSQNRRQFLDFSSHFTFPFANFPSRGANQNKIQHIHKTDAFRNRQKTAIFTRDEERYKLKSTILADIHKYFTSQPAELVKRRAITFHSHPILDNVCG